MVKVLNFPDYIVNPIYKMTHIIAAEISDDGPIQYRQCFGSKSSATRRFKQAVSRFPGVKFYLLALNEVERI